MVVVGEDDDATQLYEAGVNQFNLGKAVIKLKANQAVPQNLPPALAETIPQLPAVKERKTVAVICSGFACQPPITKAEELAQHLRDAFRQHA